MALFLSIIPVILLIYVMVKRNAWPSYVALPAAAILILFIQLFYFQNGITILGANAISGLVSALTPITVIFGAILFNRMMEVSGSTDVLRRWLSNINPNPVAQLMIIGWAFAFMIEGASGFGTPAAIAAPILIGLGFAPLRVAVFALVMNSVPVSFGAVGTPTWFGFSSLGLSEAQLLEIGAQTSIIHLVAAFVVPIIGLRFIVSGKEIRENIVFVFISILACTIPYVLLAQVNYEFPSLVGGAIGLLVSIFFANMGVGIKKYEEKVKDELAFSVVFKALLPTALLIFILVITRIHQLGIKGLLTNSAQWINANLGFADLGISKALIISLNNIFGQGVGASYQTLYVPALIPFVVTVVISLFIFKINTKDSGSIFGSTFSQIKKPFLALLGALIMVRFMLIKGDDGLSMILLIGNGFAESMGDKWLYVSSYLGAIGAFFSGSNTVSNLTFGGIQMSIAQTVGISTTLILALQSIGGAMGNMVCLNNIIAVSSVLNIENKEGVIIKKTVIPMFVYGVIAGIMGFILL